MFSNAILSVQVDRLCIDASTAFVLMLIDLLSSDVL